MVNNKQNDNQHPASKQEECSANLPLHTIALEARIVFNIRAGSTNEAIAKAINIAAEACNDKQVTSFSSRVCTLETQFFWN